MRSHAGVRTHDHLRRDVEDAGVQDAPRSGSAARSRPAAARSPRPIVWGRRRFAYEINHKCEGIYVVLEIVDRGAATSTRSSASLRLADEVVRHKLIRLPDSEAARRGLLGEAAAPAEAG